MTDAHIFERLTSVLRDVFDNDDVVATPDLTAAKVNNWDSLGNVRLFLEIEKVFSLRFSATEIASLKNVGQLAELISRKTHRVASMMEMRP
jgi:acyl carrier protein